MQSGERDDAPLGGPHRTSLAVLGFIAALLIVAWFVFARQEGSVPQAGAAPQPKLLAVEGTGSTPRLALPEPPLNETAAEELKAPDTSAPMPLVVPATRLRVEWSGAGLVPDQPILSLTRADGSWRDVRRVRSFDLDVWRGLQPGAYRLAALNGGWEVSQSSIEIAEGETLSVGVSAKTSLQVRVLGGRTSRPEATYMLGIETRWVGSEGTRLLGSNFPVADVEGRCSVVGLPLESAGQALEAVRAVVNLPNNEQEEIRSDWLPASELELDAELLVRVAEPAIVGRITTADADCPVSVYLLPASCVPVVMTSFSFTMLDFGNAEGDIIARTPAVDGEYEFRLATVPNGALRVFAVAGAYGVEAIAGSGPIEVAASGDPLRVDLALAAGGTIHGMIRGSVASSIEKEAQPPPLFDVSEAVACRIADLASTWQPRRYRGVIVPTRGDGETFELSGLPSGDYEVSVVIWPREPQNRSMVIPARRLVQRVSVSPGLVSEVVFDVDAPEQGSRLCGSVQLPSGLSPARNFVTVWASDSVPTEPLLGSGVSASGGFTLADLPPGPLTLGAVAVDASRHHAGVAVIELPRAACDGSVVLRMSGTQIRFHSTRPLPLDVRVQPGLGLAHATICLVAQIESLSLDDAGTAWLVGLPPGEYVARFGDDMRVPFTVQPGGTPVTVECP